MKRHNFDPYFKALAERPAWRCEGRIVEALGQSVRSEGPLCQLGETCEIVDSEGKRHLGEVIGFRGNQVLSMPLDRVPGIRYGNTVAATGLRPRVGVGDDLRGRVLNALGKPIDGGRAAADDEQLGAGSGAARGDGSAADR